MWYKPVDDRIGNYKAIKHSVTKELCLVGRYGEIWTNNAQTCKAIITSARIANKYCKNKTVVPGDESIVTFPLSELDKWVDILQVKNNRNGMIDKANNFGKDQDD